MLRVTIKVGSKIQLGIEKGDNKVIKLASKKQHHKCSEKGEELVKVIDEDIVCCILLQHDSSRLMLRMHTRILNLTREYVSEVQYMVNTTHTKWYRS